MASKQPSRGCSFESGPKHTIKCKRRLEGWRQSSCLSVGLHTFARFTFLSLYVCPRGSKSTGSILLVSAGGKNKENAELQGYIALHCESETSPKSAHSVIPQHFFSLIFNAEKIGKKALPQNLACSLTPGSSGAGSAGGK